MQLYLTIAKESNFFISHKIKDDPMILGSSCLRRELFAGADDNLIMAALFFEYYLC